MKKHGYTILMGDRAARRAMTGEDRGQSRFGDGAAQRSEKSKARSSRTTENDLCELTCQICGRTYCWDRDSRADISTSLCPACRDKYIAVCERCGKPFRQNIAVGECLCPMCYEDMHEDCWYEEDEDLDD